MAPNKNIIRYFLKVFINITGIIISKSRYNKQKDLLMNAVSHKDDKNLYEIHRGFSYDYQIESVSHFTTNRKKQVVFCADAQSDIFTL